MLEVKDLVKVYKTKGGAEVRALDGITLSFEEKGMVFLLGRSGSGKSTLLNVCGGLDSPDSGEIIVKGKSSKDFSAGDFDSYRNTYVGFIFQEYNILNEFSVEDNIALALELQGKPKDKEEIARILEQVELTDFAKRKPNTLSGGQKQRVAIARALVKNPEIIMADEPTGALDSNTGKQVLDTLKKLSEDKLVIVVSHDREFAEEYGDRIIELKDGKVISDVVKSSITAKKESENVSYLEDNTLLIKSGVELSDKDIAKIKKIISSSKEDVLISTNKEDISLYKKSAKIKDDNSKECFVEIDKQPEISESQDGGKFIKSKLKFKHAFKIGASGIKTKPFRFILTLFLSTVAFIMFGLLSCLMYYDGDKTVAQSLQEAEVENLKLVKQFLVKKEYYQAEYEHEDTENIPTYFNDEDYEKLSEAFGSDIIKVYNIKSKEISNLEQSGYYYNNKITGFAQSSDALKYVYGSAPQNAGEIAISEYLYKSIVNGRLTDPESAKQITVSSYEDIVLKLPADISSSNFAQDMTVKVSGVFECADIPDKFDSLKESDNTSVISEFEVFVNEEFVDYAVISPQSYLLFAFNLGVEDYSENCELATVGEDLHIEFSYSSSDTNRIGKLSDLDYYIDMSGEIKEGGSSENKIVLGKNMVFSFFYYVDIVFENVGKMYPQYNELANRYLHENSGYNDMTYSELLRNLWSRYDEIGEEEFIKELKVLMQFIKEGSKEVFKEITSCDLSAGDNEQKIKDGVEIVGFDLSDKFAGIYLPDDIHRSYIDYSRNISHASVYSSNFDYYKGLQGKYLSFFASTQNASSDNIKNILKNTGKYQDDDSIVIVDNSLKYEIDSYSSTVEVLWQVFLWTGLVLAVFAMLLLFNFIAVSISSKKKEIGILRAVGARGADVFKIFFVEAAIIVIACVILSILVTGIMSVYINDTVAEQLNVNFVMFSFGIESILTIIAIAVVTAFVSTFIPVYTYAKKKPVESIRAL